jgi:hypothetical protein
MADQQVDDPPVEVAVTFVGRMDAIPPMRSMLFADNYGGAMGST